MIFFFWRTVKLKRVNHLVTASPSPLSLAPTMSSKTPLPRMSLRARDKESQKHPGRPDLPRTKRSTQEVQAEKAEKARLEAERERSRIATIRATAELETRMQEEQREKLTTAHRPPPCYVHV